MKIVQLCGWYFPQSLGGTETYVAALAERLRAAGHELAIAAPDAGASVERTYEHEGIPVYRYPIAANPTREEARHIVPVRGSERLHAWLHRLGPDVVHLHTFVTGVGPHEIRAARETGARVFATTHSAGLGLLCQRGTLMRWGSTPCHGRATPGLCAACALNAAGMPRPAADLLGLMPPLVGGALGRLPGKVGTALGMRRFIANNLLEQRECLRLLDGFIVLTEGARQMVVSQAGGHGRVSLNRLGVRGPIAAAKATSPRPADRPLIAAYVGRFDPIKGVHDLARAVRSLGRTVPLRFEFRGPVSHAGELAVANELKAIVGPDAWVTFGAPLEPERVSAYLSTIDLLCCPSRTFEGGPTVALESMAVGTPVLGTQLGGLSEIITDGVNGRLVPPGDWRALARALAGIAGDPGLLATWRRAIGPVRSMHQVADDYLRLYR